MTTSYIDDNILSLDNSTCCVLKNVMSDLSQILSHCIQNNITSPLRKYCYKFRINGLLSKPGTLVPETTYNDIIMSGNISHEMSLHYDSADNTLSYSRLLSFLNSHLLYMLRDVDTSLYMLYITRLWMLVYVQHYTTENDVIFHDIDIFTPNVLRDIIKGMVNTDRDAFATDDKDLLFHICLSALIVYPDCMSVELDDTGSEFCELYTVIKTSRALKVFGISDSLQFEICRIIQTTLLMKLFRTTIRERIIPDDTDINLFPPLSARMLQCDSVIHDRYVLKDRESISFINQIVFRSPSFSIDKDNMEHALLFIISSYYSHIGSIYTQTESDSTAYLLSTLDEKIRVVILFVVTDHVDQPYKFIDSDILKDATVMFIYTSFLCDIAHLCKSRGDVFITLQSDGVDIKIPIGSVFNTVPVTNAIRYYIKRKVKEWFGAVCMCTTHKHIIVFNVLPNNSISVKYTTSIVVAYMYICHSILKVLSNSSYTIDTVAKKVIIDDILLKSSHLKLDIEKIRTFTDL